MRLDRLAAVLALAYLVVPNAHHALLHGAPLSPTATAAVILAIVVVAQPAPSGRWSVPATALLSIALIMKSVIALAVPAPGFRGWYFPSADFEGRPRSRIDRVIDYDPRTFPREFLNEREFMSDPRPEAHPFSVEWRGVIALPRPTPLFIEASGSAPVSITLDGRPGEGRRIVDRAHLVVRFARTAPTLPAIRVAIHAIDEARTPVTVFSRPVSDRQLRLLAWYPPFAAAFDRGVLAIVLMLVGRAVADAWAAPRPNRRLPPFAVAAVSIIGIWFVVGAFRTLPNFETMEFLQRGDDWLGYEAIARRILQGEILGGTGRLGYSSFAYPYYLAALHALFGERIWPLYFAQHVLFGVACVLFGRLGQALWGAGLAALATATILGILDVGRWYLVRFLGENLGLLMLPLLFLAVTRYCRAPNVGRGVVAGAMVGFAVLTRFNLLPFAVVTVASIPLWLPREEADGRPTPAAVAFVVSAMAAFFLFPLHQYLSSGVWAVVPTGAALTYMDQPGSIIERFHERWWSPVTAVVVPNVAFILGYPKLVIPYYTIRPHWLLLWLAYGSWIWQHRRQRPRGVLWILHAYVLTYLAVMLPNAYISGYGYRYLLLLVFVLAVFFVPTVRELSAAFARRRGRAAAQIQPLSR